MNATHHNENSLLDLAQFAQLRDLMGDEFPSLIEAFRQDTQQLETALQSAFAERQPDNMVLATHTLKSTAASLGLSKLSALSQAIEQQCRQGELPTQDDINGLSHCLQASLVAIAEQN